MDALNNVKYNHDWGSKHTCTIPPLGKINIFMDTIQLNDGILSMVAIYTPWDESMDDEFNNQSTICTIPNVEYNWEYNLKQYTKHGILDDTLYNTMHTIITQLSQLTPTHANTMSMSMKHTTINGMDMPSNMAWVHMALKNTPYNKFNNTIHHVGNMCICIYWHTHEYTTYIECNTNGYNKPYAYKFEHIIHNMALDGPQTIANYDTWSQQIPMDTQHMEFMAIFGELLESINVCYMPIILDNTIM